MRSGLFVSVATLALLGHACIGNEPEDSGTDVGEGLAYGEACDGPGQCEGRLTCASDSVCRTIGEPGTYGAGVDCAGNDWCELGLVCANSGVCRAPGTPGTTPVGDTCSGATACQAGLQCVSGTCVGFQMPVWRGETCDGTDGEAGDFRLLFEVPGAEPLSDFYRLPFPNDARVRADGTLNLDGHPSPGALVPLLGDVVGEALTAMEDDFEGFGNNQGVLMRFSDRVNYGSIQIGVPGSGTLALVNITPGHSAYGQRHPANWVGFTARRQYICDNWLGMTPLVGRPLIPGHTYAVLVGVGIRKAESDATLRADADYTALIGSAPPTDPRLIEAWNRYAPLRAYFADTADHTWPSSALAGAVVFTVQDPQRFPPLLREAVHAEPAPAPVAPHLCAGSPGPYADPSAPERGCPNTTAATFREVQGLLRIPQFQAGTPPFKDAVDGGAISFANGAPTVLRYDDVPFSLTVPKDVPMPENGWPVVLYGHGTGGHYRSAVAEGLAADLTAVTLGTGETVNFAVLTIDQVMHGPRRNPSAWKSEWLAVDPNAYNPDVLYFNALNPRAGRDNALQSAADWFAVVRALGNFNWEAAGSPTGEALRLDLNQVHYLGHSQGAVAGAVFVPYEPELQSVVFSAGGGVLIESLVSKKSPSDLTKAIAVGLNDPQLDTYHPMLNLVQMLSERSDGVNHATRLRPRLPNGPHVFQLWGQGDTYSPDNTQYALARAMELWEVLGDTPQKNGLYPDPDPQGNYAAVFEPVSGNLIDGRTGVVRYYAPASGRDAHFVMFDRPEARKQATHFLASAVAYPKPVVVAP